MSSDSGGVCPCPSLKLQSQNVQKVALVSCFFLRQEDVLTVIVRLVTINTTMTFIPVSIYLTHSQNLTVSINASAQCPCGARDTFQKRCFFDAA